MSEPEPIEITSVEEWERLVGPPDPEQTKKLAEQGAINLLRHGQGTDRIAGIPWFVRVPPQEA